MTPSMSYPKRSLWVDGSPDQIAATQSVWSTWKAPPNLRVSEWADLERRLSPEASAEPGRWDTSRAEYQRGIMDAISDPTVHTVVVMSSAQIGKALAIDTPLPTPDGWRTMGDIRVGDQLFDEDGFPCRVTAVSPIQDKRECYRVEFGDGSALIADAGHRWYVEPSAGDRARRAGVLTTQDLLADLQTVRPNGKVRNNWAVPVLTGALQLPDANLLVPPYVLGLWLGDGHSYSAGLTVGDEDIDEITALLEKEGVEVDAKRERTAWRILMNRKESDGSYCRGYETRPEYQRARYRHKRYGEPFNDVMDRRPTMFSKLRELGVLDGKFVPMEYLRASAPQRLALLQGLMDSDGYASPNGVCEFCSTDVGLADAVYELAVGLGFKPKMSSQPAMLNGRYIGPKYRVVFVAYREKCPFRLARKGSRLRSGHDAICRPTVTRRRFITKIERVESVPVKCVAVDSLSHLYLAGRAMIPTHNTEVLLNAIGYYIQHDPSPIMLFQPTLEIAEAFSKDRLATMLRDTPSLKDKVADARSRDSGNTLTHKTFEGGHITLAGANSPAGLAGRPIRIIMLDELDRYPASAGAEGDPTDLAWKRANNFWNRKRIMASTPTIKGVSRIEKAYEDSDQRKCYVPCPYCSKDQVLKWEHVTWNKDKNEKGETIRHYPNTAHLVCASCGAPWMDVARWGALRKCTWKAEAAFNGVAGFHLSELYSPWRRLSEIVSDFLEKRSDPTRLQTFINTSLGETWEEQGETVQGAALIGRVEAYDDRTIPSAVLSLTAGIDTQDDRLEVQIIGWGKQEEAWVVWYEVIPGDPAQPQVWKDLDELLLSSFQADDGRSLKISATCIDTGGHHAAPALSFCRSRRALRRVFPTKGMAGPKPIWPPRASRTKTNEQIYLVGVDTAKDTIYGRLKIGRPGPGFIHFPHCESVDATYFEQLTSETVVTRYREGRPYRVWTLPKGKRNEALDTFVLALAARHSLPRRMERGLEYATVAAPPLVASSSEPDEVAEVAVVLPSSLRRPALSIKQPLRFGRSFGQMNDPYL